MPITEKAVNTTVDFFGPSHLTISYTFAPLIPLMISKQSSIALLLVSLSLILFVLGDEFLLQLHRCRRVVAELH
jgi:hypothetical protein